MPQILLSRCLAVVLSFVAMGVGLTTAQDATVKPFVEYDHGPAEYLRSLHGRTGELAWRTDFPGGFPAWQTAARNKLTELLGLQRIAADCEQHQPTVTLAERTIQDGYWRQKGQIETEPGVFIPFWILTPDAAGDGLRPLVICAHGHDSDGWNTYAGIYRNEAQRADAIARDADPGVQAVRRGYVALIPATRGLAEVASIPDLKGRHGKRDCRAQLAHCLLAGRTPIGERVWDTQRLIDWAVLSLPGIDARQLVLLGNSGGGVLTVYAAAIDTRISVAVPSCSFTSFTSATGYIFHCDCCLVPRVQSELGDMADIGGLTAPRALLAVHGRQDELHSFSDVEKAMARVASIYQSAGVRDPFDHQWADQGHKLYPELMWPFITHHLKKISR